MVPMLTCGLDRSKVVDNWEMDVKMGRRGVMVESKEWDCESMRGECRVNIIFFFQIYNLECEAESMCSSQ